MGCLFMFSCNRRPKGVLSEKKMVELITEMELTQAYLESQPQLSYQQEERENLIDGILLTHNVTREDLDTTWGWYGKNLDDYSKLLTLVDKRISEKKKDIFKADSRREHENESGMLWPYSRNGIISPLSATDGFILSLNNPELKEGDRLIWRMHINQMQSMNGVLGVEYDDGTSAAVTSMFTGKTEIELSIPTDTGKIVKRIYGDLRFREDLTRPVFIDSISLKVVPFDSVDYYSTYSNRRYGPPSKRNIKEKTDTIDSIFTAPNHAPVMQVPSKKIPMPKDLPADPAPLKMIQLNPNDLPPSDRPVESPKTIRRPKKK